MTDVVACDRISFPFKAEIIFHTSIYHILFIHPMDIWIACTSWLLWIMLLWTWCASIFWDPVFNSFGYMPWSGVAGSYDSCIFFFLRNCHTVYYSNPTKRARGFPFLHSLSILLMLCFFIDSSHPKYTA